MHLATAKQEGVSSFQTYDTKNLAKWAVKVGFPIEEPYATQPVLAFLDPPPP